MLHIALLHIVLSVSDNGGGSRQGDYHIYIYNIYVCVHVNITPTRHGTTYLLSAFCFLHMEDATGDPRAPHACCSRPMPQSQFRCSTALQVCSTAPLPYHGITLTADSMGLSSKSKVHVSHAWQETADTFGAGCINLHAAPP